MKKMPDDKKLSYNMKCFYCQKNCSFMHDMAWCAGCDVNYFTDNPRGIKIKFERTIGDKRYGLILFPEDPHIKTILTGKNVYLEIKELLIVTPDNVKSKIKTLLVFS
jgi:hypothetical protein